MKKIILSLFFLALSTFLYSQQLIELYIDGKKYVREYPETLAEATGLIDSIVYINNSLDKTFIEYQETVKNEEELLMQKINLIEEQNNALKSQLKALEKETDNVARYAGQKSSLLLSASAGAVFNPGERMIGQEISFGLAQKVRLFGLFNLYAGLNINTTIYYQRAKDKIQDIGAGLYLGIFLK